MSTTTTEGSTTTVHLGHQRAGYFFKMHRSELIAAYFIPPRSLDRRGRYLGAFPSVTSAQRAIVAKVLSLTAQQ